MAGLTPVEVLTMAGLSEGPAHGYGLVLRIAELTEGRMRVRPGNLYRVLNRLETSGLVEETSDPTDAEADDRRRYFRLTAKGRRRVTEELGMYATVLARVPALRKVVGDA